MSRGFDVTVVGSGIVGLGAAYAAAKRGLSVVVVDRTSEPIGASIRNFGHLCFTPQTGDARRYGVLARELWLQLATDAGFWLRETGTVVVARHDDELALLDAARRSPLGEADRLPVGEEIRMLDAAEVADRTPVRHGVAAGGAFLAADLQTDPRSAVAAIIRRLQSIGVEFRMRTAVGRVRSGVVETSRGDIATGLVVVAVNHDIDQLLPDAAEENAVERCALDMLRVDAPLPRPLGAPLLTGWSLIRYRGFAGLSEASAVRERLHGERPDLAAIDLNQMFTQLPDGSLLVGDTHWRGVTVSPFQSEAAVNLMLAEAERLLDVGPLRVRERWQGVYAAAPNEFLVERPQPGVLAIAATTGIGMTTGLGLAEHHLALELDAVSARTPSKGLR
ncbi:TIGR03364 family FAD-dependent oxidoreductase [Pseudoclavibacter sp. AY1H1]|uniref:TIGR03364 family FAD-dependent oxidoreductase n=1 Tax=Pseudoclavibacter sp. AY1H1 TaxID=2080584 RepID=UPI000CE8C695|nr:TIGR03364 family FAD-dependent oxidoreductase [Pseudoclavibacter sp. AY1H1]PPF37033.1 TIGR03364 family FAD-dependent oxidoreductase [Pseudoclavibacter sp. AY1H1]